MKTIPIIFLLCLAITSRAVELDEKVKQAVQKAAVSGPMLNTLTPNDVPDKWKTQKQSKETERYVTQIYLRGGAKRLEVMWSKEWRGEKEKMFVATVFRGETRILKIARLGESFAVMPPGNPKEYEVMTLVKDDGSTTVTVKNKDGSFVESVVVKNRETHLIDDLEYTKTALAFDTVVQPLAEALEHSVKKRRK